MVFYFTNEIWISTLAWINFLEEIDLASDTHVDHANLDYVEFLLRTIEATISSKGV